MDFTATRGREFRENFDFKNGQGKAIQIPSGKFKIVLEHGNYAQEFTIENRGLVRQRTQIIWHIPAQITKDFAYNTLYYTLYLDKNEIIRGILRVQEG